MYLNSSVLTVCLPKIARVAIEATRVSPLLRAYQAVGRADVVLTAPQTYGIETMRWARTRLAKVREELVAEDGVDGLELCAFLCLRVGHVC